MRLPTYIEILLSIGFFVLGAICNDSKAGQAFMVFLMLTAGVLLLFVVLVVMGFVQSNQDIALENQRYIKKHIQDENDIVKPGEGSA